MHSTAHSTKDFDALGQKNTAVIKGKLYEPIFHSNFMVGLDIMIFSMNSQEMISLTIKNLKKP